MSLNDRDMPLILVENNSSNILSNIFTRFSSICCKGVTIFPEIIREALLFFVVVLICAGALIGLTILGIYNYIIPAVIIGGVILLLFLRELFMYRRERKVYIEEQIQNNDELDESVNLEGKKKPTFRSKWGKSLYTKNENKYKKRPSRMVVVGGTETHALFAPPPGSSIVLDTPYAEDYVLGDLPVIKFWQQTSVTSTNFVPRKNVVIGGHLERAAIILQEQKHKNELEEKKLEKEMKYHSHIHDFSTSHHDHNNNDSDEEEDPDSTEAIIDMITGWHQEDFIKNRRKQVRKNLRKTLIPRNQPPTVKKLSYTEEIALVKERFKVKPRPWNFDPVAEGVKFTKKYIEDYVKSDDDSVVSNEPSPHNTLRDTNNPPLSSPSPVIQPSINSNSTRRYQHSIIGIRQQLRVYRNTIATIDVTAVPAIASNPLSTSQPTSAHNSSNGDVPTTPERTPEQRMVDFYNSDDPTEHLFETMWDDFYDE